MSKSKLYDVYMIRYPGIVYHAYADSPEGALAAVLAMEPKRTAEDFEVKEAR